MPSLPKYFVALAEKLFGIAIYRALPRGVDPLSDLKLLLSQWHPTTIFDVGANVGQSALIYSTRFPLATIFSFEPATETFNCLKHNMATFPNVRCFQCAFGSEEGTGFLSASETSEMNRVIPKNSLEVGVRALNCEVVVRRTIDDFCEQMAVGSIDYLKVDTEGSDLEVMKGAQRMLHKHLIDVVEVEVGIGLDNDVHVSLQDVRLYLEPLNYQIFGFYEQVREWKLDLPHLRRANVLFISGELDKSGQCEHVIRR